MALEIMKTIIDAEQRAEQIKKDAQAQGDALISQAEKQCAEMGANVKQQAKQRENELIKSAITESQGRVRAIADSAQKQCESIKKTAEERMDKAVSAVIGKVVGVNGDC